MWQNLFNLYLLLQSWPLVSLRCFGHLAVKLHRTGKGGSSSFQFHHGVNTQSQTPSLNPLVLLLMLFVSQALLPLYTNSKCMSNSTIFSNRRKLSGSPLYYFKLLYMKTTKKNNNNKKNPKTKNPSGSKQDTTQGQQLVFCQTSC